MRLEPHAIGRLAARLAHGSAVISATNGKTTTAAMVAAILERGGTRLVHNRAGANMAGGVASALLQAARRGTRLPATPGSSRSTSSGSARSSTSCGRARCCSRTSSATSSTATASSTRSPTAGPASCARTTADLVLNADDPTVADLGRARGGDAGTQRVFFGVEDDAIALAEMQHAADAKHCRRCGAPYRYDADLPRAPRPLPLRQLRRAPPEPGGGGHGRRARGRPRRAVHAAHARPASAPSRCPSPASTTSTTRSGPRRWRSRWAPRSTTSPPACRRSPPRSGGPRRSASASRELSILLVKNPAGANEVLRTLALEPGEHDLLGDPQRPGRRRARRELGVGRRLRGPRRPRARTRRAAARARRRWRCG